MGKAQYGCLFFLQTFGTRLHLGKFVCYAKPENLLTVKQRPILKQECLPRGCYVNQNLKFIYLLPHPS